MDEGRSDVSSENVSNKRKYVDKDGKEWVYKLAWQEDEGKWCIAYGNTWLITSSILIFNGSVGNIVLSPKVTYVVK